MQIGAKLSDAVTGQVPGGDSQKKIADAAKQFEALLINQMLETSKPSSDEEEGQDSAVADYGRQQFAQALANRGGLGIAKMVVAGLQKHAH